jgi:hypothetical protein
MDREGCLPVGKALPVEGGVAECVAMPVEVVNIAVEFIGIRVLL